MPGHDHRDAEIAALRAQWLPRLAAALDIPVSALQTAAVTAHGNYAHRVPHNDHLPGWDQLPAVQPGAPIGFTANETTVVFVGDDAPREYLVETWDRPYGTADYAHGTVVDRLASIVTALAQPARRVRITRLDPPCAAPKPPPVDPAVWPEPVMVQN